MQDIQRLTENIQLVADGSNKAGTNIESLNTKFVLSKLVWADGATFDAFEDSEELNALCLDNTRVDLLNKLREWIADPESRPLFWLNGMAGTGKSTISRTLAKELAERKQLGASFFFKEGEGDRGNARRFFSTIAAQLAQLVPALALHMKKALELDPYIGTKAIKEQFEKLIIEPLQAVKHRVKRTIILVVDALDECKPASHVITILNSFSRLRELRPFQLRVFLTSRPEHELRFGFELVKAWYQDILLHEIARSVVAHDIAVYFDYRFNQIRSRNIDDFGPDWPGKVILDTLTERASPLFIFAATVCRFIGDFKHDPLLRLKSVLENQDDEAYDKVHNTYRPILERLLEESTKIERPRILENFRQVVGPIAVLFEPLSVFALSTLLQIDVKQIKASLNGLHSVLNVPKDLNNPVRTLHLSFVDFLLAKDRRNKHQFWLDASDIHFHLANRCLDLLLTENCLKQDICDLKNPGILRADIDDTLIKTRLFAEVQYACRYWTSHMKSTNHDRSMLEDRVIQFLSQRFFFWFEAVSLLGRAQEMILMISDLSTVFLRSENSELAAIIHDARRFVQANCYIVDTAPLQLYSSCAIFSPKQFVNKYDFLPTWLSKSPAVSESWGAAQQTLESHSNTIIVVVFSPDGKWLASTSTDRTIKLWDVVSGQLRDTFGKFPTFATAVAFSNRSKLLAATFLDETIMVWDVEPGQLQLDCQGHSGGAHTMAFSRDDKLFVFDSDDRTIKLWNTTTGQLVYTLEGHLDLVISLVFLPINDMLISGSVDKTINLWNLASGQLDRTFVGGAGRIRNLMVSRYDYRILVLVSLGTVEKPLQSRTRFEIWNLESEELQRSFSSDANIPEFTAFVGSQDEMLVSVSMSGMIELWNIASGQLKQKIDTVDTGARELHSAISLSGENLAIDSTGGAIEVWRLCENQFQLQQRLAKNEGLHEMTSSQIGINPEGTLMASGDDFGGVRIWEIDTGVIESKKRLSQEPSKVRFVIFSPDGNLLASGAGDLKAKIWDVRSGQLYKTIWSTSYRLTWASFSMDGNLLASGDKSTDMQIWDIAAGQLLRTIQWQNIQELVWQRDLFLFESETGNFWLPGELWQLNDDEWVNTHPQRDGHLLFNLENNWLCRKGERFLWLPPDWRGRFDQYDGRVALGLILDQVITFEISADELDRSYGWKDLFDARESSPTPPLPNRVMGWFE